MSADKSRADVLADKLDEDTKATFQFSADGEGYMRTGFVTRPLSKRAAKMLRTIPALEAERDRLQKANDGQTRLNITLVMENKELIAERDKLRAEVQRWSVLAASFEAERNLLRAEVEALRADAKRLDFIAKHARSDPKMDGQHVWWPTTFNNALRGPTLREAIDAARKQQ